MINRGEPVEFTWNGRPVRGYAGDTIISALAAAGERVFSRSMKYHRPRGLLSASFHDPGCMVQVGDEPNVRGAHRLAADGMAVTSQNTWPSLRLDAKAVNRFAGRFLTAGFYYKTFMRPRFAWPAYEGVLRRFVNAGTVSPDTAHIRPEKRHAHPDVLIAGGGPAGMAAAISAARAGASVLLVEEEHALGGHLRWGSEADLAALADLATRLAAEPGVEVLTDAVVLGRYDGNALAVLERRHGGAEAERLIRVRAKTLVVAPGLIERPYVFAGNDLPGVMLSTAVRRLINLYAVKPGQRAVVLTANPDGDAAIADLKRAGVEVVRVEDARLGGGVVAATGRGGVHAVQVADGTSIACDLLVTAVGWTAPTSLLNASGDRPVYNPHAARFFPDASRLPEDVLVTGGIAGDGSLDELTGHAAAVGAEAARRAARIAAARIAATPTRSPAARPAPASGTGVAAAPATATTPPAAATTPPAAATDPAAATTPPAAATDPAAATTPPAAATDPAAATMAPGVASPAAPGLGTDASADASVRHIPELPVDAHPELFAGRTNGFVDFSEDVSAKDLRAAVAEGYDSAPSWPSASRPPRWDRCRASWRRSTRWRWWPRPPARTIAETGTTTWRPPYAPVTLGALAGRAFEPVRLLPDAALARAPRRGPAGRRAVDPAGPLRRRGGRGGATSASASASSTSPRSASWTCAARTCPKLLNLLYVNKWSKLEVGRVRYGVMCAEDGVVLDDGVTGRLGERALPDEHDVLRARRRSGSGWRTGCRPSTRTGRCTSRR